MKGFISSKKLSLTNIDDCNGYGSTCIENNNSNIPSFSLNEIQEKYNLKFNVLIADCEGFLGDFFDENPDFYDNLRLIIFEADYPEKCDYNKIKNNLIKKNFTKIIEGSQNLWVKFESEEVKYYQKGLKYNLFYKINEGYFLEKTTQSKELGQFYLDYFAIEERKTKLVKFFVAISQTDLDIKKKMFNDLINDPDCDNDIKTWSNYNLGLLHPK